MELLATKDQKEIWLLELDKPYNLASAFNDMEYVCILFNNDPDISNEDQNRISDQLVRSGCKYAVCAGFNCSSWDDSVDLAYLATDENYDPPDETFVMTSWHENESAEEIIFFGLNGTNFDDHYFNKYLVLFVGHKKDLKNEVESAIQTQCIDLKKC
jgi:hypothetical protein